MPPVLDRFRRRRDWIPARTFAWLGLVLVLAFWVLDAVAHVIVYQHGTLLHSLFSPEPGVVALRIASTLGIITVLFATNALNKRTRTAENERRTAQENLRLMFERSPDALVERADHAMYAVKDALGGGFGFAEESGLVTELDQKM